MKITEKIKSGIIGFVVGDALGVPVEFLNRDELSKHPIVDMIGYGTHNVPKGTWSDDTSMMLATMDSIIENKDIDYNDIMYKFSEWTDYAKYTATHKLFDIGISTRKAIINFKNGEEPLKCGCKGIRDNGNGSLMRILPIVFYLDVHNFSELEEVEIINNISSITHAHEISCLGCKIFSDYVKQLLCGKNKFDALDFVKNQKYREYYSDDTLKFYDRILDDDISKLSIDDIKSSGFVVASLEASLWCTLNSENYEQAVLKAVNLGNDTDTIGALTGALNGIIYGEKDVPDKWLDALKNKKYLYEMTEKFIESLYKNDIFKKI